MITLPHTNHSDETTIEMTKRLTANGAESNPASSLRPAESADDVELNESTSSQHDDSSPNFPVVGIVASAGGLSALKQLFAAMKPPSGMAFVVVPHLDASHKSQMVELLAKQTSMQVLEAVDGMILAIDTIYVIPPNRCLELSQSTLRLSDLPVPIGSKTAIDTFLRSLAQDKGELAIGIILSGTGSHGTLGIREIKRCGGMAIAQTPATAEFDQMPRSAIETGLIDFTLNPEDIPASLLKYVKHPYVNRSRLPLFLSVQATEQLKGILELIRSRTKYDFRNYRTNMLMRRIERRMGIVQADDLQSYIELLANLPDEVELLCKDFLIGVTSFFREAETFAFLENELIPEMVAKNTEEIPLRVWVTSCATGEEAYSIAILFLEAFQKLNRQPNLQIFASDINQQSINVARRGIYPASIASDVSSERLEQFFVATDAYHFQVGKKLRESIVFSKQNVISDSPFSKLDLICCRNLLIYLDPEVQQKLISLFHYALRDYGYLLLGPAETIGRGTDLFEPIAKKWRVFRRVGPSTQGTIAMPVRAFDESFQTRSAESRSIAPRREYKDLTEAALKDYTPAAVLVNRRYEVLYVSGCMVDYLEFPTGELSKDLLAMARSGLRTRLRSVCHQAMEKRVTIVDKHARVQRNGRYVRCSISARPIVDSKGMDSLLLVMFRDIDESAASDQLMESVGSNSSTNLATNDGPPLVQLLEYELKSTREELQNTIEEMESTNEELQSSNEELESSKEELQSLNEELSTVNCQLSDKVSELDKSNSELTNLMASTEIATLYLDNDLRIKRFTKRIVELFSLVPADEGRDIRGFASQIMDNRLLDECQQVLREQRLVETEIYTTDHRCFLRRILPFRRLDQGSEGVVVSYVDLTAIKKLESEQRERDACFREMFNHAATGIAIGNLQGYFENCNPAYCQLLGYSEAELLSKHLHARVHPEDLDSCSKALHRLQVGESPSYEIENRYCSKDGSIVWVRELGTILPDGSGTPTRLMVLVTDVTSERSVLQALKLSEERNRAILKTASDAIITIDKQGNIDSLNQSTEAIFGYTSSELIGQNASILMPYVASRQLGDESTGRLDSSDFWTVGTGREVLCRRKDGSTFPADLAVSQVDHLGFFTGVLRDISSRKEMQKHILEIATDEQRRIGLELHDGIQQELTGLSLYTGALQETTQCATQGQVSSDDLWSFTDTDFGRLKHTVDLLSMRLSETNQHVRDLAHGIMPVQIDAEGLQSALIELARAISSDEKTKCVFRCNKMFSMPDNTTATHLYRIAQEAINNSIRHGSADSIEVVLSLVDGRIALDVIDNGVGIATAVGTPSPFAGKGMGMRTMEYRASLIGGRVQLNQNPSGGTHMRCEILNTIGHEIQ